MKSISNLSREPAALPIVADDVLEFHAARILLLVYHCGIGKRIEGLTKLAKLDFFVRYPNFFQTIRDQRKEQQSGALLTSVESTMVRYHYGPWDKRYYHLLPLLEAKQLITISKVGTQFQFKLTDAGTDIAKTLSRSAAYQPIITHMKDVKRSLGDLSGSTLKKSIYKVFHDEVASRSMGETIT